MTSTFDKIIALGPSYVYAGRTTTLAGVTVNSVGKWDGTAGGMTMVENGVNNPTWGGLALKAGPNINEIYVAGSFTQVGAAISANRIAFHNGTSWNTLGGAPVFDNNITSLALDTTHNLLYAGSHQTSTLQNRISVWNGTSWTGIAEATINDYLKMDVDSDGNLYVGYGTTLKRRLYSGGTWETLSSSIGGTINDLKFNGVNNRVYVTLYLSGGSTVKYYDITGNSIGALPDLSGYPRAVAFDSNNNIFVACQTPSVYQGSVVRLDGGSWTNVYNYQNTSGVLDLEMDANDNIYCWANAGSLTIGIAPYGSGAWQQISASTSTTYGGPIGGSSPAPSGGAMDFAVGDEVCLAINSSQHGYVVRLNPLGVAKGLVVKWLAGPVYTLGKMTALFGEDINKVEHV